jgi:hypothetical protein
MFESCRDRQTQPDADRVSDRTKAGIGATAQISPRNGTQRPTIAFKINGRFMNWWQVDIPEAELSNAEIWNWR